MAFSQRLFVSLAIIGLTVWTVKTQTCLTKFLVQPGENQDVEILNCNLTGSTVRIHCALPVVGFSIIWHYTKMRSGVGSDTGTAQTLEPVGSEGCEENGTACVDTLTGNSTVMSILILESFSTSENAGYYWCERAPATSSGTFKVLPSQVIHFDEPQGEREYCPMGTYNFSSPGNDSCAYGAESLRTIDIISAVNYPPVSGPTTMAYSTRVETEAPTTRASTPTPTTQATEASTRQTIVRASTNPPPQATTGGTVIAKASSSILWQVLGTFFICLKCLA